MPAGGFSVTSSKDFEAKITPIVIISCIMAATGGLMFGYDIGVTGGVTSMNGFLIKFFPKVYERKNHSKNSNYCKYDNQGLQLFTSSLYLAGLAATFFAPYTTRRLGQRLTMLIAGIFFIAGIIFNGAAQNLAMLIVGRLLLGCGVGFTNQDSTMGMEALPRPGRHTIPPPNSRSPHRRRHTQQSHRARQARRRQGRPQKNPRHHRRRARVPRNRRGQPHRQPGQTPLPQTPPSPQPPPARHRHPLTDIPAVSGHQRDHILRAGPLDHAGLQERRLPLLRRHHRRRQRRLHHRLHLLRRQARKARAPPRGRRADVHLSGRHRRRIGHQGHRPLRQPRPRVWDRHRGVHLPLCVRLRVVLGAAGLAHPERDVSFGDQVGGAERGGVHEPARHVRLRPGVPHDAVPSKVRHLRLLLGVGGGDVALRAVFAAGDEECAHRGDGGEGVEAPLVLEALHRR